MFSTGVSSVVLAVSLSQISVGNSRPIEKSHHHGSTGIRGNKSNPAEKFLQPPPQRWFIYQSCKHAEYWADMKAWRCRPWVNAPLNKFDIEGWDRHERTLRANAICKRVFLWGAYQVIMEDYSIEWPELQDILRHPERGLAQYEGKTAGARFIENKWERVRIPDKYARAYGYINPKPPIKRAGDTPPIPDAPIHPK